MLIPPLHATSCLVSAVGTPVGQQIAKLLAREQARVIALDPHKEALWAVDSPSTLAYSVDLNSTRDVCGFNKTIRNFYGEHSGIDHFFLTPDREPDLKDPSTWGFRLGTIIACCNPSTAVPSIVMALEETPANLVLASIAEQCVETWRSTTERPMRLHRLWAKQNDQAAPSSLPLAVRMARAAVASVSLFPDADQELIFAH